MTISRIENGENAMSILLFQIVSFLDISEEEVIRLFRNCDKACRKHRDGDKNIRFYIYVTKNIYVI
ncbi:MAG: hypothetical protein ACLVG5_14685 [Clostridium sp.]